MNKNEQMVETIKKMIDKLRTEKVEFTKAIDERIAAAELMYETFAGQKAPETKGKTEHKPVRRMGRRGMKIDRQGVAKTYAFLQERGNKTTTTAMVARKFNISPEAASQRFMRLVKDGRAVRVTPGQYIDAAQVKNGAEAQG